MHEDILATRVWLPLGGLILMATAYVRLTWWLAQRWGPSRLIFNWLGATAFCALIAAAVPGPSTSDERMLPRPFTARSEAALLASVLALPAVGFATLSVRRRIPRRTSGRPTARDLAAGVLAGAFGASLLFAALIVVTVLLLP